MSSVARRLSPRSSTVATVVIAAGLLVLLLGPLAAPSRAAFQSATLSPPQYDSFLYIPGEEIAWTIQATPGDRFDVEIVLDSDTSSTTPGTMIDSWDDRPVPTSGLLDMTYRILDTAEDSVWYWLRVYDASWIENGRVGLTYSSQQFTVQGYRLSIETERSAYLPGDTVTVTWSANMVRDGSLAPDGVGRLWAYDSVGGSLLTPSPHAFTSATGSFSFSLSRTADPAVDAVTWGWFNDTPSLPRRHQWDLVGFAVNELGVRVSTDAAVYRPGSVVTVSVDAKITINPLGPSPLEPGAANAQVVVTVTNLSSGAIVAAYGSPGPLVADAHGSVTHVFQLGAALADGTQFEVAVDATANGGVYSPLLASDSATFTVQTAVGISVQMRPNKAQFASGDVVSMQAFVYGESPGPFTFVWEARDVTVGGGNALLNRTTGDSAAFTYPTPATFEGRISFTVVVSDGRGNRATQAMGVDVAVGWLAVSADRSEFSPRDTIAVSWSLVSNVIQSPTYFYDVRDDSGEVVASGIPASGSVSYAVPQNASTSYTFSITASEAGRVATGTATVFAVSGVFLGLGLDRPSYLPGDVVQIRYTMQARGRSVLPTVFTFQLGLAGGPFRTQQTTTASGVLAYAIPPGIAQGNLVLGVFETNTGASAILTVTVGPTNPLWAITVADVPLFVILLGVAMLLVVILLVRSGALFPHGLHLRKAPGTPPEEKPGPPTAEPGPSPMSVTCRSCAGAIEVTTSKRPIEVMCPTCGETQMVP